MRMSLPWWFFMNVRDASIRWLRPELELQIVEQGLPGHRLGDQEGDPSRYLVRPHRREARSSGTIDQDREGRADMIPIKALTTATSLTATAPRLSFRRNGATATGTTRRLKRLTKLRTVIAR